MVGRSYMILNESSEDAFVPNSKVPYLIPSKVFIITIK